MWNAPVTAVRALYLMFASLLQAKPVNVCIWMLLLLFYHLAQPLDLLRLKCQTFRMHVCWQFSESDIRPSIVTHTRNLCSAFDPSKVHTHSSEHTPGAVGSHLCCGTRGAVGGSVPCSREPQSWYWGWREYWTFTPPPTIPAGPRLELTIFRLRVQLSNH